MDEIGEIRHVMVEPSPDGPRRVGIVSRTIIRPGVPPVTQQFDPPISEDELPPAD